MTLSLLSFAAYISSTQASVLHDLQKIYADIRQDDVSATTFQIAVTGCPPYGLCVSQAGDVIEMLDSPVEALGCLENLIDTAAIASLSYFVIVHAGVVATDAGGIVIPGAPGVGKSTLVAALSSSGFRYLSDELAILDPSSLTLRPFAKGICLKSGGWRVFSDSYERTSAPVLATRLDGSQVRFWSAPSSLPVECGVQIKYVLIPERRSQATPELIPLSRSRALAELAQHSLNLPRHNRVGLEVLARAVEESSCFTLKYDGLQEAVAAVTALTRTDDSLQSQ